MLILKKIFIAGIGIVLTIILVLLICNYWVIQNGTNKVFSSIDEIPSNKVALVLGTNPLINGRYENPYFNYRIDAAAELYHFGKIKHFILSGDNGQKIYDEPTSMKEALMTKGVPEHAITLDYAGFRTLDSVIRAKEIFQQSEITIISQEFHNYRAVFIANKYDIDAVAFNATQPFPRVRTKPQIREYFARCKAVFDLYLLNKQPKFLGEKINIEI